MKKTPIILLALVMLLLSSLALAACSPSGSGGVTVKNQGTQQEVDKDVSIEKTTLLDTPEITIVADALSFKNDALDVELTLTNKLSTPISAQAGTLGFAANYINSYMVNDGYMSADLGPSETLTEDVSFNVQELKMMGITQIGEIGIGVTVKHDQDGESFSDWNHDQICQEILMIKTDKYDSVDMSVDTYPNAINDKAFLNSYKATVLKFNNEAGFEQSGIRINTLGLMKNKDDDVIVLIEIQNDTESLVSVRASDVSIDGEMVYEGTWTGDTIAPGKIAIMDIILNRILDASSLLEESGVSIDPSSVSQIGIEFSAYDADSNTIVSPTELELNF